MPKSELSKSDFEKAMSRERGFPVFLSDKEYEQITSAKPASEPTAPKSQGELDGYADAEKRRKASPEAWTTAPGVTYNNTHGRERAGASRPEYASAAAGAHASAYKPAPPPPEAPGSGTIGKLPFPSAPSDADYAPKMTYQAPPTFTGAGIPKGWNPKPVDQYAFGPSDFDLPLAGDPLKASAPAETIYPTMKIVGNPAYDPWANDEQKYATAWGKK